MDPPSHLKSLQALELAARTGSFAAAAESLAITPAAVGQRVKALEDYLGIVLLERGRAGIRPTPELLEALPDLSRGFAALEAASAALDMQKAQELHIAAAPDFADLWLKPRLASFRARHPNIRFCINGEGDAPMRLARVDCEIRFEAPIAADEQDLLFRDFLLPVASPAIVSRMAGLDAATCLEGFPLLHVDFYREDPEAPGWPRWVAANCLARTAPERGMRFRRIAAALNAVTADAGVALCGVALLSEALAAGKVRPAYPPATGLATGHGFCVRHRQHAAPARALESFDLWLREQARSTAAWLARFQAGEA